MEPEWLTGGTNIQRAVDSERAVWRQIKPGDSKDRLIKKTAKPRGRFSGQPCLTPPSFLSWPRPRGCRYDICPHGNSRRGGREPGSAGVTSRVIVLGRRPPVWGELTNARKFSLISPPHPLTPSLPRRG